MFESLKLSVFYIVNGSLPLTNNSNQLSGYLCVQFGLGGEIFVLSRIIPCYFSSNKALNSMNFGLLQE
jgi:hypothetical protein